MNRSVVDGRSDLLDDVLCGLAVWKFCIAGYVSIKYRVIGRKGSGAGELTECSQISPVNPCPARTDRDQSLVLGLCHDGARLRRGRTLQEFRSFVLPGLETTKNLLPTSKDLSYVRSRKTDVGWP